MKINQCAALVAVADSAGFTSAAETLGISQSAVSHAIAALEAELGCALLERHRGGVRPTGCGREVLAHARSILAHSRQIQQIAESTRDGTRGTVLLATSQSFGVRVLPTLLNRFRVRFPHQEIVVREGSDPQIAQWLRRRTVHLGVVTLPKEGFPTVPLWQDEMRLLVAAGHRWAGDAAVPLREVAEEPLIMPAGGVESIVRAAMRTHGVEPRVVMRIQDLASLMAMVAAGLGATVLPATVTGTVPASVASLALDPSLSRHVALGVSSTARHQPAVSALIGMARELAAGGLAAA